jgi:hypothetical protein
VVLVVVVVAIAVVTVVAIAGNFLKYFKALARGPFFLAGGEMIKYIILLIIFSSFSTWGQSMKELNHKEKVSYFFENLTKDKMHLVDEFYHADVDFIDPVGQLKGAQKMKKYYEQMYVNVKTIKFEFSQFIESSDMIVGIWKMTLVTDKLNSGEPIVVDGNSVIRFDSSGKAIYHRDYFDMGAFIYEHIPMVGFVVKKIRNRMKAE